LKAEKKHTAALQECGKLKAFAKWRLCRNFPAGEVSNKNNPYGEILDKEWEKPALKLIRMAKVPVVPMYFHAKTAGYFIRWQKFILICRP
jgi:putative hemolysin